MGKLIHKENLQEALAQRGWTQAKLGKTLGVSSQAVTNWVKGVDFPRPDKLLKLATTLHLSFDQLVIQPGLEQPVIAFRKRAGTKTTEAHLSKARAMGMLLKPLVEHLPDISVLRTKISSPSTDYAKLHHQASRVRSQLGLNERQVLGYDRLIGEFKSCGAVLIPVLWGQKQRHENALHISLKSEDVTFIYLNLETRIEDFKFWMAHELAHVYTPEFVGTDFGEDFADALSGALLFPHAAAEATYSDIKRHAPQSEIQIMQKHAHHFEISLNTVYQGVKSFAASKGLEPLLTNEKTIHAVRNSHESSFVSKLLFGKDTAPEPTLYISTCERVFQTDFFSALRRMIIEKGSGESYLQQIMDVSLQDAHALHRELRR